MLPRVSPVTSKETLRVPRSVFVDSSGGLYIADRFNQRVRRVSAAGVITTLAGDGTFAFSGNQGAANRAQLASPSGLWLHDERELFIADSGNHRVRRIDDDNVVACRTPSSRRGRRRGRSLPPASSAMAAPRFAASASPSRT